MKVSDVAGADILITRVLTPSKPIPELLGKFVTVRMMS